MGVVASTGGLLRAGSGRVFVANCVWLFIIVWGCLLQATSVGCVYAWHVVICKLLLPLRWLNMWGGAGCPFFCSSERLGRFEYGDCVVRGRVVAC